MPTSDYQTALSSVLDIRERGWTNYGDPVQTRNRNWVLPGVQILTYEISSGRRGYKGFSQGFADEAAALRWITENKVNFYNLYRIEKVNGTWRTDW